MVDDVDDLLVEQPRVDRVTDSTDARDAVIQLEMAEGVPSQSADPVAGLDPEPQQRASEPLRAALGLGIGVAVDRSFDGARDDFGVAMIGAA